MIYQLLKKKKINIKIILKTYDVVSRSKLSVLLKIIFDVATAIAFYVDLYSSYSLVVYLML